MRSILVTTMTLQCHTRADSPMKNFVFLCLGCNGPLFLEAQFQLLIYFTPVQLHACEELFSPTNERRVFCAEQAPLLIKNSLTTTASSYLHNQISLSGFCRSKHMFVEQAFAAETNGESLSSRGHVYLCAPQQNQMLFRQNVGEKNMSS